MKPGHGAEFFRLDSLKIDYFNMTVMPIRWRWRRCFNRPRRIYSCLWFYFPKNTHVLPSSAEYKLCLHVLACQYRKFKTLFCLDMPDRLARQHILMTRPRYKPLTRYPLGDSAALYLSAAWTAFSARDSCMPSRFQFAVSRPGITGKKNS